MEMKGEHRIEAPRSAVWEALNDPEVLKASIPGCEELEKTSPTEFTAKVKAKVGPVSAKFAGAVTLSDINAPEGYRISGEGKGGAAGFAKGGATVRLAEDGPDATILTYEADAQVGGKLAQIGSRLIDGTARKMADQFFTAFSEQVAGKPDEGVDQTPSDSKAAGTGATPAAASSQSPAKDPTQDAPAAKKPGTMREPEGAGAESSETLRSREPHAGGAHADEHGEPAHEGHGEHAGHHGPPEPIHDPNVGAGVKPGIYITAAIVAAILLFFIFGLGGGGEMTGQ